MQVPNSFSDFKNKIGETLQKGKAQGLDQQIMELGNMMAKGVTPKSPEEKLVQEVWSIANPHEKEVLAQLMIRLVGQHLH